jgi:nitric oxide reductase activation protein
VAEPVERVDGVEVRPAADDELRQDGREADDRDRDEVDEEERRPAVGRGLEREPPDVAQTDPLPTDARTNPSRVAQISLSAIFTGSDAS